MMRNFLIIIVCFLAYYPAVQADDRGKTMFAAAPATESQWQQMSMGMLPRDYDYTADNNRRLLQQRLAAYSNRALNHSGAYAPAIGVLGTAIGVAATDTRYNLNNSKTMGLLLKDSTSSRRSILLEFRKHW